MITKYFVLSIVMLFMIPSLLFAECLNYEPDAVSLIGKIIQKTFPGRPNYESVKTGDEPETYWILITAKPFCIKPKAGNGQYSSESKIEQVQLVFMSNEYKEYKGLIGKDVVVYGQLFPMQTGHHHTKILITVKKIKMNKS